MVGERVLARLDFAFIPAHGLCRQLAFAVAIVAALALTACGRAGPLELPPGPAVTPAPSTQLTLPDGSAPPGSARDTALKNGFDAQGNPVAAPGQKKSFILDPLLN